MSALRRKSLLTTLGVIVVLVESLTLTSLGLFYSGRFSGEIDNSVLTQVQLPGALMNSQLLRYESLADKDVMRKLAGEEFVEGALVGADGKTYYATDKSLVGKTAEAIPGFDPGWLSAARKASVLVRVALDGEDYAVSVTPITAYTGGPPVFYAYVKVRTRGAEAKKTKVALFFILGAGVCIVITSLLIILAAKTLAIKPLKALAEDADRLADGHLDAAIRHERPDEIGDLARSFETMRQSIRGRIGELQTANRELDESRNQIEAFINALPDVVFMMDSKGRYLEIMASDPGQLYLRPEQLKGKLLHDVFSRDVADMFLDVVKRTIETGETQTVEYALETLSGKRWFEGRASRIKDAAGAPGRVAWVSRDVTMRRELEETLRQATREAEDANRRLVELDRLKTSFLSSVSHELRTPLTSLLGFAKLIKKNFKKYFTPFSRQSERLARHAKRIVDDLGIIEHEGERLTRLINDVLDLSKIESGRMQWNEQEVDPGAVISRAVGAVGGMFRDKPDVRLEVDVPDALPRLRLDPDRLQQALMNLLNNAAKFTEAGEIRISAWTAPSGVLRISVSDTGQGIREADKEHVFEAFYQSRRGDNPLESREGTGLGLSICRQIVERYGGTITVESSEGKGSVFTIELPVGGA